MSLIDSDKKYIGPNVIKRKGASKKSGLSRFASLNKFEHLIKTKEKTTNKEEIIEKKQTAAKAKTYFEPNSSKKKTKKIDIEQPKVVTEVTKPKSIKLKESLKIEINKKEEAFLNQQVTIDEAISKKTKENAHESDSKQIAKQIATDSKQIAKQVATDSKQVAKQIAEKPILDSNQIANKIAKRIAVKEHQPKVFLHNVNKDINVSMLTGQARKFLEMMFLECQKRGDLAPRSFTTSNIAELLETSNGTVKSLLNRLSKKNYIVREKGRPGKAGWLFLSLPKEVYTQFLDLNMMKKTLNESSDMSINQIAKQVAKQIAPHSSSSNSILNEKKTTTRSEGITLEGEWSEIDTPKNVKELGFGATHLKQLIRRGAISAQQTQENLYNFSQEIDETDVNKKGPTLRMFMGVSLVGDAWVSDSFLKDLKLAKARALEAKKIQEAEARQKIDEALSEKAAEYIATLTDDAKKELYPPTSFSAFDSDVYKKGLLVTVKKLIERKVINVT